MRTKPSCIRWNLIGSPEEGARVFVNELAVSTVSPKKIELRGHDQASWEGCAGS